MRHLDLFSGIGGFALAAEWAFGEVEHVFCDNEPFAQAVLQKHWPKAKIYGDIRQLTADAESRKSGQSSEQEGGQNTSRGNSESRIDILTGGFPCQPFSAAGLRRGTEDDRYLWPEMLRVIREFHPRWVIGENVGGLVTWNNGMVLEQVCADLEEAGYEVQPFIIPACAVNAPHRRDRVWIVAHIAGKGLEGSTGQGLFGASERFTGKDTGNDSDTGDTGLERRGQTGMGHSGFPDRTRSDEGGDWSENWLEVATRLCGVFNGLSRRMDRTPRLKALGNAIVPQVAYQIMMAIKEVDLSPSPEKEDIIFNTQEYGK